MSDAVGFPVVPTFRAVYLADPPGSLVAPHIDKPGYDLTVHLVLEHTLPASGPGSALLIHRPRQPRAQRYPVGAGEAVVVLARATVHSWARLGQDERRLSAAIGFAPD